MTDPLRDLLHAWTPSAPRPDEFRRAVWQRLREREAAAGWSWLDPLRHPAAAAALLVVAVVAGLVVGERTAEHRLARSYASLVNPFSHHP
jgi:hypothetical protein